MAGNLGSYEKDFKYLQELSNKGQLQASNGIYKKLAQQAKGYPPLARALDTLSVNW